MKAKISIVGDTRDGTLHVSQIVERGAVAMLLTAPDTVEPLRITLDVAEARLLVVGLEAAIAEAVC